MSSAYLYVDGSDLEHCATVLAPAFDELAARWSGAVSVNKQQPKTTDLRPHDLADWFLGINFSLEQFSASQASEIVAFAQRFSASTGREFVVGVASGTGITEDLVFLGANSGEHEHQLLCAHLGGL